MIVKNYFAILRNLRNIMNAGVDEYYKQKILDALVDKKAIRKSLVLPFRFMTAFDQLSDDREITVALNKAVEISLSNVPRLPGKSLIALDVSGSMSGRPADIGSLFCAVLVKTNDCDCIRFSDDAEYATYNPLDSISTIRNQMRFAAGGTNFHAIFQTANKPYDRIIILSDMQAWIGYDTPKESFRGYKRKTGADSVIYSFDLEGYGTLQFPERNVYCLAGFSEKIFDIMGLLETDRNVLIHEIERVEI